MTSGKRFGLSAGKNGSRSPTRLFELKDRGHLQGPILRFIFRRGLVPIFLGSVPRRFFSVSSAKRLFTVDSTLMELGFTESHLSSSTNVSATIQQHLLSPPGRLEYPSAKHLSISV